MHMRDATRGFLSELWGSRILVAGRVPDDRSATDAERSEKRVGVPGKLLKRVLMVRRFGRFAKSDLVGSDYMTTRIAQRRDTALPSRGDVVLSGLGR
jgi:hypothetical protein